MIGEYSTTAKNGAGAIRFRALGIVLIAILSASLFTGSAYARSGPDQQGKYSNGGPKPYHDSGFDPKERAEHPGETCEEAHYRLHRAHQEAYERWYEVWREWMGGYGANPTPRSAYEERQLQKKEYELKQVAEKARAAYWRQIDRCCGPNCEHREAAATAGGPSADDANASDPDAAPKPERPTSADEERTTDSADDKPNPRPGRAHGPEYDSTQYPPAGVSDPDAWYWKWPWWLSVRF